MKCLPVKKGRRGEESERSAVCLTFRDSSKSFDSDLRMKFSLHEERFV